MSTPLDCERAVHRLHELFRTPSNALPIISVGPAVFEFAMELRRWSTYIAIGNFFRLIVNPSSRG